MRFLHSDIDYGPQISASAHLFDGPFKTGRTEIADTNFLLPFNPVVTELHRPPSAAFFGFNAYCAERDFPTAKKEPNFAVWCQGYYTRLFNVMEIWKSGLGPQHQGPFYYTNFVKLVLRQSLFMKAKCVDDKLSRHPDCARLFEESAICEVEQLKAGGCKIFICFGGAVYNRMWPVAHATGVKLIKERHFSRYDGEHTKCLVSQVVQSLKSRRRVIRKHLGDALD